ncbi:hypothetical protein P5673_022827 [Acropora cervicornis]|uniref:Uncharacterized protein n=1 Tax=Acropora cervicornis TaxID=6130 RepID=A0AAD9Q6J4_ACRCE|nr:hypothetical protein P5673_022827 [Acropora cervicornis]
MTGKKKHIPSESHKTKHILDKCKQEMLLRINNYFTGPKCEKQSLRPVAVEMSVPDTCFSVAQDSRPRRWVDTGYGKPDDSKKEKKGEKKRQRISSSSGNENSETIQDGTFVTLKLTEYQALLGRLKAVEDTMTEREKHILQLEAKLCEAETSINEVKTECSSVAESLTYTQKEQDDLKERMSVKTNCPLKATKFPNRAFTVGDGISSFTVFLNFLEKIVHCLLKMF